MQEDNIAIRLKFLISDLGINSSIFADNCGISRATLSQLLTGRNKKISDILIGQIHKAYPKLSILWLLFDEGDMWLESDSRDKDTSNNSIESEKNNFDDSQANYDKTGSLRESPDANIKDDGRKLPEIQNSLYPHQVNPKYSEEKGLNYPEKPGQESTNQHIKGKINTPGLINEIEQLRSKIKKVTHITIYYDDSTFETFFPK